MTTFFSSRSLILFCGLTISLMGCTSQKISPQQNVKERLAKGGLVTSVAITPTRIGGEGSGETTSCDSTKEENEKLWNDYMNTLEDCRSVLAGYETDSIKAKRENRWIMIIGAVAGSVVVPSLAASEAAKSTIAAWGGLSGVTNVASHTMETEGLDAAFFLKTRENVKKDLDIGIEKFIGDESDYCARRNAVAKMAQSCLVYSISAPAKAE